MLFHDKIIEAHLAETLDEALHDVTVTCRDFQATGYGRIRLDKGQLLLDLYMDAHTPDRDRGMYYAEGVPMLKNRLSNGSQLTVGWLSTSGSTSTSRSDRIRWRASAASVQIEAAVVGDIGKIEDAREYRAFVPAGDGSDFWQSGSRIVDDNPHFGRGASTLDWAIYRNGRVEIPIRRYNDDLWQFYVTPAATPLTTAEIQRIGDRVLVALGIVLGRQVRLNASYRQDGRQVVAILRTPHRPLGVVTKMVPPRQQFTLFTRAMDYLLTLPDEHVLFACLNAFWNSSANFWPLNHLLLASATEGLAKVYRPGEFCARDRFMALAAELGIPISDAEFESWQVLRNALAHGSYAELGDDRATGEHGTRIKAIFNKVLLAVIGYRGPYINYATPGWPAVDFPPTADLVGQ